MRISVPRGVVFAAALVAAVIPVSRYARTWFRDISADKHIGYGRVEHPESSTDPQALLAEANRLYWLNNGPKAAPLYAKAENLFASQPEFYFTDHSLTGQSTSFVHCWVTSYNQR